MACDNLFFWVIFAFIILGKEYVKMHNINVYMAPLIAELQVLWRGVASYDVARAEGQWHFMLRIILMWMIHDFSAYGLVAGCVY
jgi:hypothetical protein